MGLFVALEFKIPQSFRGGYAADKIIKHNFVNRFEGELVGGKNLFVMDVDQAAHVKTRNQLNTQVVAIDALADAFLQVDLNFCKDKIAAFLKVCLVNFWIAFFEHHTNGGRYVVIAACNLTANDHQDVDGIHPFKIEFVEDFHEAASFKIENFRHQIALVFYVSAKKLGCNIKSFADAVDGEMRNTFPDGQHPQIGKNTL